MFFFFTKMHLNSSRQNKVLEMCQFSDSWSFCTNAFKQTGPFQGLFVQRIIFPDQISLKNNNPKNATIQRCLSPKSKTVSGGSDGKKHVGCMWAVRGLQCLWPIWWCFCQQWPQCKKKIKIITVHLSCYILHPNVCTLSSKRLVNFFHC